MPASLLAHYASAFTQSQRLLQLDLGEHWQEALLPLQFSGDEALCHHDSYQLDCLSPDAGLPLKTLLGLPASVSVLLADGSMQTRHGVVSAVAALGADGGFARYRLTIEAPFSLLRHRRNSRVFQDLSVPDIVRQLLAEHQRDNPLFARLQTLAIRVTAANVRRYCLQYRESDADFIVRLLHEEGYTWRFHHQDGQVQLCIDDEPHALPQAKVGRVRFHRSDASEHEDGLSDWLARRQIIPDRVSLASHDFKYGTVQAQQDSAIDAGNSGSAAQRSLGQYEPQTLHYAADDAHLRHYANLRQQALDRQAKQFHGSGTVRGLAPGQWFRLADHPVHDRQPLAQREFVVTAQQFLARNNLPDALRHALPVALWQALPFDALSPDDPAEPLRPTLAAAPLDDRPYHASFSAQRRGLPLTPDYAAAAKPTAPGAQTAIVVGPAGEEVHTDPHGRIKVQFHWQRPVDHPRHGADFDEHSSCWLRVAMPGAGNGFGHQFIPRIGEEVLVTFVEGDIDRPLICGVLYNGRHRPPQFSNAGALPANKTLSGIRSREHHGQLHNELLFDDTAGQVRVKLSSDHGYTQLNQGWLASPRQDGKATPRGDGFELRSDRHGAIRAAHGLLLSSEAQPAANGPQLARTQALSGLDAALTLSQQLAEQARQQQAETQTATDDQLVQQLAALQAWPRGSNCDSADSATGPDGASGQQPLIVLSAPAGIASISGHSQTVSAAGDLHLISGRDGKQSTARRWLHNVGEQISMFVAGVRDKVALQLIAAHGKVEIQAQHDSVSLLAGKDISVCSTEERIVLSAREAILLNVGGGAYIRLSGGDIELHCPGQVSMKATRHDSTGPTRMNRDHPDFPDLLPKRPLRLQVGRGPLSGQAWQGMPYTLYADGAKIAEGVLDGSGQLLIEEHRSCDQEYILQLANGARYQIPVVGEYRHAGHGELANAGQQKHRSKAHPDILRSDQHQHRHDYAGLLQTLKQAKDPS